MCLEDVKIGDIVDVEGFGRGVVKGIDNGKIAVNGDHNTWYWGDPHDLKFTGMTEKSGSSFSTHGKQQEVPQDTSSGASDHQNHYKAAARQPIEFMQELMSPEAFDGFLLGNILKYRLRAGFKDDTEKDLEKAAQYAHWRELAKKGIMIDPERDVVPEGFTYEVV